VAILLDGRLLAVQALDGGETVRHLRLTIRGRPQEKVQTCLRAVPGVEDVTMEALTHGEVSEYLVRVQTVSLAESLVAALVAHGFGVLEIRPERADLETLFLQLTGAEAMV
jgi:hypothetical protein